jgi:CVNH domain-containing protein
MRFNWCLRSIASVFALLPVVMPSSISAQGAPPPGPYTESCRDIQMQGTTLSATCQEASGKWVHTKMKNAAKCADGLVNTNAVLSCRTGLLPPGSYVESCDNVRLDGATLKAACRNEKGKSVATELKNANQCRGDIANQDGALKCITGPQAAAAPEKTAKPEKKKKKRFLVF